MVSKAVLEERRKRAVQMILEGATVTPALDYDEAEVLLNWALAQAGEYALSSRDMGDKEAQRHIAQGVSKVRALMQMVNDVVEQWDMTSGTQLVQKLTELMSAAMEGVGRSSD